MPLLHGKQIQNTSVNLNKLTGTGSLILQTGATFQVPTANITTALDVVNKYYVDSLAAGLNPHAAVKTATTGNLNLSTATSSPFISGVTVSTNDRILVWQQSNNFFNGIYVYNGSTFSRATDMDGNPSAEIAVGDYTFVISGSYSGNGYVVVSSGTYSGVLEPVDVAPIVWSQFTGPASFIWGNGLVNNANTISVNMASGSGLTFSGTGLTINSAIAGNGLSWTTGVLSVNTANGLQITSDNVEISPSVAGTGLSFSSGVINIKNTAVTANSYGDADTVPTITFNAQGQAIAATAVSISITSGQVNNFTASVQSIASASASNGLSVSGNGVILGGQLTQYTDIDLNGQYFQISDNLGGSYLQWNADLNITLASNNGNLDLYSPNVTAVTGNTSSYTGQYTNVNGDVSLSLNSSLGDISLNSTLGDIMNSSINLNNKVSNSILSTASAIKTYTSATTSNFSDTAIYNIVANGSRSVIENGGYIWNITEAGSNGVINRANGNGSVLNQVFLNGNSGSSSRVELTSVGNALGGGNGSDNVIVITDTIYNKGAVYADDYSSNFTPESLVSKRYVDSVASSTGLTAQNGLTEISENIVELGGILLKNTTIDVDNYNFDIDNVSTLTIDSSTASIHGQNEINLYSGNGGFSASYFTLRPDVLIVEVDDGFGGGAQLWVESPNVQVPYAVSDGASASMKIVDDFYQKGLVYVADYTANFTENSLVTKQYVDDRIAASSSQVSAGVGITISNVGKISLSALGATTSLGSVNTVNTFTYNNYGQITTSATVSIAIPSGQITNFTASVNTVASIPSGQVTNFTSSVQALITASMGTPVYTQRNMTPVATTGNGASSSLALTSTPKVNEHIMIYVNGQLQFLGNGTATNVDCYFGTVSTNAKAISALTSGDVLFWNGTYIGFDLSTTDKIDFVYNA